MRFGLGPLMVTVSALATGLCIVARLRIPALYLLPIALACWTAAAGWLLLVARPVRTARRA